MEKILIADDAIVEVRFLSGFLTKKGFDVVVAVDALQAWMTALRVSPDAIILDIKMPGGSGLEVLRKLKLSSKTMGIPVVVVSGSDEPDMNQVVTGMGAAAFLKKPVDLDQLWNILLQLVRPQASVAPEPLTHGAEKSQGSSSQESKRIIH